jgi:hypothetical protein
VIRDSSTKNFDKTSLFNDITFPPLPDSSPSAPDAKFLTKTLSLNQLPPLLGFDSCTLCKQHFIALKAASLFAITAQLHDRCPCLQERAPLAHRPPSFTPASPQSHLPPILHSSALTNGKGTIFPESLGAHIFSKRVSCHSRLASRLRTRCTYASLLFSTSAWILFHS